MQEYDEISQKINEMVMYLSRYSDYVDYTEVMEAKHKMYESNLIIDDCLPVIIMFANYIGSLKRLAFYKYVHKEGVDVRYLYDAYVKAFMFNGVYMFELEKEVNNKYVKQLINKTRYPKWTKIGLIGGSIRNVYDLGKDFSAYMDGLSD